MKLLQRVFGVPGSDVYPLGWEPNERTHWMAQKLSSSSSDRRALIEALTLSCLLGESAVQAVERLRVTAPDVCDTVTAVLDSIEIGPFEEEGSR